MNNIKWNLSPDDIIERANKVIIKSKKVTDNAINIKSNNDVISSLSNDLNEFNIFHNLCGFLQYVSPNDAVRKASSSADLLLSKYVNEFNLREDIYMRLLDIKKNVMEPFDLQFVNKLILNFQRNGINLSDIDKQNLLKIHHKISKLENVILKYVRDNENNYISLTLEELRGLPTNVINSYEKESNKYRIQFNRTNYNLFMKYLNDSNVRKMIDTTYSEKYDGMLNNLVKLIILKDKHAKELSYDSHSDFKSHIQMTKNSGNIKNFLAELLHKLDYRYKREIDTLMKIMTNSNNFDNLNTWDVQYFTTKWRKEYGINDNDLKEYFELDNTIDEIFAIYEKIFGININKVNIKNVWHKNVKSYEISENNNVIGYLHLDLHSRDGKYKQTRCYCIQPATYNQASIVALVASFCPAQKGLVLLNFVEVISLFHEIAHVMHYTFGKTKHSIFSGANVESDFIETPAQILDLLCWEKNIIHRLSRHYKTGQRLQDSLISKLIKLKNLDIGLHYKRHILVALFDQIIYSSDKFIETCESITGNTDQIKMLISGLYEQLHDEIMVSSNNDFKYKITMNEKCGLPIEWIGSLCDYDSQYYRCIWSRVLSSDIYNEKIKGRELNSDLGTLFRNKILMHGGTKPAYDMICDYIERKPAIDGFISMHDLDTEMEYSFFLTTDQIKNEPKHEQINKTYDYDTYVESVSNRFSEINESAIEND